MCAGRELLRRALIPTTMYGADVATLRVFSRFVRSHVQSVGWLRKMLTRRLQLPETEDSTPARLPDEFYQSALKPRSDKEIDKRESSTSFSLQ